MAVKKARLGIAVVFCGLLFTGLIVQILSGYNQLTERLFASIQQQTGFDLETDRIHYDSINHKLTLTAVSLAAPGLNIKADTLQVAIAEIRWIDMWRTTLPVSIRNFKFQNALVQVDPSNLQPDVHLLYSDISTIQIESGVLLISGSGWSLPFSFLTLNTDALDSNDDSSVQVQAAGVQDFFWNFEGALSGGEYSLTGVLTFENQPLSSVMSASQYASQHTSQYSSQYSSQYKGELNATLSVQWTVAQGLSLQGKVSGSEGQYTGDNFSFSWKHWGIDNYRKSGNSSEKTAIELQVSGLDLSLSKGKVQQLPSEVMHRLQELPVVILEVQAGEASIHFAGKRRSSLKLENIEFQSYSQAYNKIDYGFEAHLPSGGRMNLTGSLAQSEKKTDSVYRLNLERFSPDDFNMGRAIAHLPAFGKTYNFSYNSSGQKGVLDFSKKMTVMTGSLLERLLIDSKGRGEIIFVPKATVGLFELWAVATKDFVKQLEIIGKNPYQYLSILVGQPVDSYIEYIPGKAILSQSGSENIKGISRLITLRPWLKWQIEVSVSNDEDWPQIARFELENTLDLLYHTSHPDAPIPMPLDIREQLLEQMYLGTQQQKLPDVGLQSREERIKQAEQFLVDSWPKNPKLMNKLLTERIGLLKSRLDEAGFDRSKITIKESSKDSTQPRSSLILL